jgi:hypothetical protein
MLSHKQRHEFRRWLACTAARMSPISFNWPDFLGILGKDHRASMPYCYWSFNGLLLPGRLVVCGDIRSPMIIDTLMIVFKRREQRKRSIDRHNVCPVPRKIRALGAYCIRSCQLPTSVA